MTKAITTAAVMMLIEDGKLKLDEYPIQKAIANLGIVGFGPPDPDVRRQPGRECTAHRGPRPAKTASTFASTSCSIGDLLHVTRLADLETVLLTEWWEGTGPIVKRLWREIRRAGLQYQPRTSSRRFAARDAFARESSTTSRST